LSNRYISSTTSPVKSGYIYTSVSHRGNRRVKRPGRHSAVITEKQRKRKNEGVNERKRYYQSHQRSVGTD